MSDETNPAVQCDGVWQPIETAPKDGTYVLVYEPYQDPTIGWFSQRGAGWCMFDDNVDMQCKPTHWMPLPEKPVGIDAAKEAGRG